MKKTLKLSCIDPLIFAGANDQNMQVLLKNFNSNIVLRGDTLNLDGPKNEIHKIESLINDTISTINKKGFINPSDLEILIHSSYDLKNEKSDMEQDLS